MTVYYVDSSATGGTNAGTSWANAYLTFAQAVTAATANNDQIWVGQLHAENLTAATTYTFAANVRVLCINSSTGALTTGGFIGNQGTGYNIVLAGAYNVYFYGLGLKTATTGTAYINLNNTDGGHFEFENCTFTLSANTSSYLLVNYTASAASNYTKLKDSSIFFGGTGANWYASFAGPVDLINITLTGQAASPALILRNSGTRINAEGCDFSLITGTLFGDAAGNGSGFAQLSNCKLGSGVIIKAAATTVLNKGNGEVIAFNCSSGNEHFRMYHGNALGSTTISTAVYANDGASYNGVNRCSWYIVSTANASYWTPYVSPWFDKYWQNTNTAITPRIEIIRGGTTTAYQNDELWAEWSYQGVYNIPQALFVNTRMVPLGTPANIASSTFTAAEWTGEGATNWFGKLSPASSFTPLNKGYIRARIIIGEPSITIYVDPLIRIP